MRIRKAGLDLRVDRDFEIVNPESDPRYRGHLSEVLPDHVAQGVTPAIAQAEIRRNHELSSARCCCAATRQTR